MALPVYNPSLRRVEVEPKDQSYLGFLQAVTKDFSWEDVSAWENRQFKLNRVEGFLKGIKR